MSTMCDSDDETTEEELKVVLLGDCGVGKTNLVKRFCRDEFSRQYFPTTGVDFFLKRVTIQKSRSVVLKIWDVGGGSHSGNMLDKYVFGSNVIIFVYDVTNETTFYNIKIWLEIIKNIFKHQDKKPLFALVGNKCDLEHQRVVKIEKHDRLANEFHLFPQTVSSRTGECVSLAFQKITAECLGIRLTKLEIEEHQPVVKAEISTYSDIPPQTVRNLHSPSRSSVCLVTFKCPLEQLKNHVLQNGRP